tara:strand:- start:4258 stop:4659 length:402 start_codon:yes stop_codon:yes gene_type:complete
MSEKETKKETLRRLFTENGLVKEDVFEDRRGFVIITRTGIDKIVRKNGISLDYEINALEQDWVVMKCEASHPDMGCITSFGEASKDNCTSMAAKFPVAMAEKRAKSRAVLMLAGFYEQGVFGQDEMENNVEFN